jgi:hypothetical protein
MQLSCQAAWEIFSVGGGEGGGFVVLAAGGQAVVEAAEEAAEQVALGGGVPVAGDERGGQGNVTAALCEPRVQEVEFRPGECRADDESVKQFVLGCAREPLEEHLMPRGEIVRPLLAPVTGLIEGSVDAARPLGSARPATSNDSR